MGRTDAIATLNPKTADRSRFRAPEQGIRRGAVRAGVFAVRFHTRDFRFKQGNAGGQFVLRIGAKIFASEAGSGVS